MLKLAFLLKRDPSLKPFRFMMGLHRQYPPDFNSFYGILPHKSNGFKKYMTHRWEQTIHIDHALARAVIEQQRHLSLDGEALFYLIWIAFHDL
jgi:hypothetical protein